MNRRSRIQMRRADQDVPRLGVKWTCSYCMITYYEHTSKERPTCPMCAMRRELEDTQRQLAAYEARVHDLTRDSERLQVSLDYVAAIRSAMEFLDDSDTAFLKSVLYRWRDSKNLTIKALYRQSKPIGFEATTRGGNVETHKATSMGGMVISGALSEMVQAFGTSVAVMTLAKGLSALLKGGT